MKRTIIPNSFVPKMTQGALYDYEYQHKGVKLYAKNHYQKTYQQTKKSLANVF